jgi:hypothetical protein
MKFARFFKGGPKFVVLGIFLTAIVLSGCATPVGVRHMDSQEAHGRLAESVLAGEKLSAPTMQILNRSGLAGKFGDEPAEVIAAIHRGLPTAREPDRLFALAELSFLHAKRSKDTT